MSDARLKKYKASGAPIVKKWAAEQRRALTRLAEHGRFSRQQCAEMAKEIARVQNRPLIFLKGGKDQHLIPDLALAKGVSHPVFVRIEAPATAKEGDSYTFTASLRGRGLKAPPGGCTYRMEVVSPPRP